MTRSRDTISQCGQWYLITPLPGCQLVLQTKPELIWPDINRVTDVAVLPMLVLNEGSGRLLKHHANNHGRGSHKRSRSATEKRTQ
jgi:hypothetical protein